MYRKFLSSLTPERRKSEDMVGKNIEKINHLGSYTEGDTCPADERKPPTKSKSISIKRLSLPKRKASEPATRSPNTSELSTDGSTTIGAF